jgi:hypothetical protein
VELAVEFVPAAVEFVAAAGVVVFVVAPWTPPFMFNVSIPTIIKSATHLDDLDVDGVNVAAAADEERSIAPHRGACTTEA